MNDIMKVFENSEFGKLEVLWKDGKAYFPAVHCAEVLGYSNPHDAIIRHCKVDGLVKHEVVSKTTNQHGFTTEQTVLKKFITEGNLYRLIIRSKLESAQRFERWVFDEVLPTIRKYGFYATDDMLEEFLNDPDLAIGVFSKLKEEREKVRQLESENKKLTEKSEYLDLILRSPNAVPITVIAKDYDMSAQEMNGWLRCIGVQYKLRCGTWVLYQAYVGNGYTKSNTFMYDPVNCKTTVHTQWTQKGRRFIYEKLKAYGVLPVCERGEDYENPSIPD